MLRVYWNVVLMRL